MYRNQYNNFKRQKKRSKKNIVRIFWQLPAKKSLGSLDFRALRENTVEMKFTRLRELTPLVNRHLIDLGLLVTHISMHFPVST